MKDFLICFFFQYFFFRVLVMIFFFHLPNLFIGSFFQIIFHFFFSILHWGKCRFQNWDGLAFSYKYSLSCIFSFQKKKSFCILNWILKRVSDPMLNQLNLTIFLQFSRIKYESRIFINCNFSFLLKTIEMHFL